MTKPATHGRIDAPTGTYRPPTDAALAYACECAGRAPHHYAQMSDDLNLKASITAHARTIMQYEAFKREVSDALREWGVVEDGMYLSRFIIDKPDPLAEAWIEATGNTVGMGPLNEALAKRGGKIVWEDGQ